MDQTNNPLNLAMLAASAGNLEAAATQWERARSLVPNAVLESPDSIDILIALKRYDEAEQLMLERRKWSRGDRVALMGLATIAEHRDDPAEALKRWKAVKSRINDTVEGYIGCARNLIQLGRYDEAATQLKRATRRDPANLTILGWRARLSDRRADWPQSIVLWKELAEIHNDQSCFAFVAKAMIELGQFDEAEAYLAGPSRRYAGNLHIVEVHAMAAERRGDLAAACDRWAAFRAMNPNDPRGYHDGARCLIEAGRAVEADTVLRAAIARFPDQVWPSLHFARLAHQRRDWNEAAVRWEALRRDFPAEAEGYSLGAEALTQGGRAEEATALRRAS